MSPVFPALKLGLFRPAATRNFHAIRAKRPMHLLHSGIEYFRDCAGAEYPYFYFRQRNESANIKF